MLLLRSVVLPALAVVFNLLTVAAAFGVLALLFQGDHPLLGGPGFLDAITASGVFSVTYGLSIDYQVFLLTRMREGYDMTGTTEGALDYGLRRTAGVVTGAALIMAGVFFAFATTDFSTTRELGVGLTVAVLLDATLVRLILLPGTLRLIGDRVWHRPKLLRRIGRKRQMADPMDMPMTAPFPEGAEMARPAD
jgi:putative drug exporter of the RND superfamily